VREQVLHGGDQKGRRLARAGLGLARDILSAQGERQGLRLDWRAILEACVGKPLEDAWVDVEAVELDVGEVGLRHGILRRRGAPVHGARGALARRCGRRGREGLQISISLAQIAS
jgi:hypothetical protein